MADQNKLFLLDAYALIFRAYYAFISNPIKNTKGQNTSTIFGFINTLDEILRKEDPSHIAVVFDPPTPTFRNELFPEYKANREETPEDIRKSVPFIKKILEAYSIPVVEIAGFEADDVIGAISVTAAASGFKVYMMTSDKDYAQLVNENVFIFRPRRSDGDAEILGVEEVKEKFGVEHPSQVIDILALWGDSSDNVPGVPGIGEKTSKKIISEFKSLENVYDNLDKFKGKQKENLENFRDQAFLSKKLVTIVCDIKPEFEIQSFERKEINKDELSKLFKELEFKTLHERILGKPDQREPDGQGTLFSESENPDLSAGGFFQTLDEVRTRYSAIKDIKDLEAVISGFMKARAFCFDTETTGLDPHSAKLVGIALSNEKHKAWFIPVKDNPDFEKMLEMLKTIFEDKDILKVGQNLKYDIRVLWKYGLFCRGRIFDTMVAHYLLQPEQRHNLNLLSESYLRYSPVKIESLIGKKGKEQRSMDSVELDKITDYACEDADLTWQLYEILEEELKKEKLDELAENIEFPLVYVLSHMEHEGVKIDKDNLKIFEEKLIIELKEIEEKIYELSGEKFNISSPKQLGEILFEKLRIDSDAKKTKTKQYSTSEDVLVNYTSKHEIVPAVLDYRSVKKLLSTYVEALPKLINRATGRVHTSFNQTLVATGRLSSNNPNLQNIPIREERGREIRKSFVPRGKGYLLLAADYSQIELRLMAHLSNDEAMIEAFRNEEDIHTATAAKIFGKEEKEVSRDMRSTAKTANFGIIYGISAFGLSQRLNISRSDAKDIIDGYFKSYPAVKEYMDESIRRAREEGCVYTLLGRRRFLPDINSRNSVVRGVAERNAINAPIQGSAADIIKIAMVRIQEKLERDHFQSKMILQVHDELIFDTLIEEKEDLKRVIRDEMEGAFQLKVPLIVELGEGNNWLEAH